MISDSDKNVNDSTVRSFADDTRITKGITCTNDATNLQNDLSKIYDWANQNKMTFNGNKFELLRYKTKNTNIQDSTSYITATGETITEKCLVKDLGVLMSNDCSFKKHIEKVISSMRNILSWILRTFLSRNKEILLTTMVAQMVQYLDYTSRSLGIRALHARMPSSLLRFLPCVQDFYLARGN